MCHYKNIHKGHKVLDINDKEALKKEKITMEDLSKEIVDNKNKLEELKNKVENEIIKIDKSYEKINNEVTKSYELKHEKLTKEENELKDKLKNEVTKAKENLEINLSDINEEIRFFERIIKGIKKFQEEENQILKILNYISKINKNKIEILQQLMKNLCISFKDEKIEYKYYYFNGLPIPKDIKIYYLSNNSFKISWEIDEIDIINVEKKQLKYGIEMKKENNEFISVYENKDNFCIIKNLDYETNYEIRICSIYNNNKSSFSQIYKIKTDFIDSNILGKNEKRKEYLSKILEWTGFKTMKLLYRGTRDGMNSNTFHNKCNDKGKTICLFLNDKGNIFGGYSSIPWSSEGGDKIANDCFLFTLTNIYNIEPTKFPYIKERSVFHGSYSGPTFGKGCDLGTDNNFYSNNNCWSNFPNSYYDSLNKGKSIFTGHNDNQYFILKELEVFELL